VRAHRPACKIFAVEVSTSAPLAASLAAGSPQVIRHQPSFVDGIGSKSVFPQMFQLAQELNIGSLVAPLENVAAAVRQLAERNRTIAEGAGACAAACALAGGAGPGRIVCVVSGGNIDSSKLSTILARQIP
jgi:threonine dehydratase